MTTAARRGRAARLKGCQEERDVRRLLGLREWRTPFGADADTEGFTYEIKCRQTSPFKLLERWYEQAIFNRTGDRTPVLVVSWRRSGHKTVRRVYLDFDEWIAWHGPGPEEVSDD